MKTKWKFNDDERDIVNRVCGMYSQKCERLIKANTLIHNADILLKKPTLINMFNWPDTREGFKYWRGVNDGKNVNYPTPSLEQMTILSRYKHKMTEDEFVLAWYNCIYGNDFFNNSGRNDFHHLFSWSDTPQGYVFWSEIDNRITSFVVENPSDEHDKFTETVEELKKNRVPFYMLTEYEENVLRKIGRTNCVYRDKYRNAWLGCVVSEFRGDNIIYRIKSDFKYIEGVKTSVKSIVSVPNRGVPVDVLRDGNGVITKLVYVCDTEVEEYFKQKGNKNEIN
jgi:hypothetical protein